MGLNIIRRPVGQPRTELATFCIAAAAVSYYQNTDRTVHTQHHGFSGCIFMNSVMSNLERDDCTTMKTLPHPQ